MSEEERLRNLLLDLENVCAEWTGGHVTDRYVAERAHEIVIEFAWPRKLPGVCTAS